MKTCPVDPKHQVKEISLSPNMSYELCEHCKEDVDFLARQRGQEWENNAWVQAKVAPAPLDQEVDDFDGDEDEDDDQFVAGPRVPPQITPQMRPTLDLGQGTHQLVLHSDDNIEATYVMQILIETLGKNPITAQYMVMDCHMNGRTKLKLGTEAEMQALLAQVEAKKTEISQTGRQFADTILNLTLAVEQVPAPPANNP